MWFLGLPGFVSSSLVHFFLLFYVFIMGNKLLNIGHLSLTSYYSFCM
uniref:Uncharacterized protein n=1 Tax=Nelumbo nucifera TaxID=4432 RepID=A0A822YI05_NELNU|nr:TPA_asm: hypothetical protein HUJ06_030546 [Nelumbo nucifera]DAD43805.1 TPA_asm: hypothetical protein HUJ06_002035 [Nelumbo nucifera]